MWQAIIHALFILSAIGIAAVERMAHMSHTREHH
jgi:uncharacterized membrane protein YqhA